MASSPTSQELDQFIARYIGSVEQLEILCLLSVNPAKPWSVSEVFRVIQSSEPSVQERLEEFQREGFLVRETDGLYRYAPKAPDLTRMVAELAKAYQERRVTIVEMIYRPRGNPLQDFADAFRLRKEK
ncbi:MAG TPA: hypothetical protein VEC99_06735 [Clostridia bacterium]|nr:hypothetical protein [Clostridia bacterium]